MKFHIVTYANHKYQQQQMKLLDYCNSMQQIESAAFYTDIWLKTTDFFKQNKNILMQERGSGMWCWKSFIILETLKKINRNDTVFYLDCGDMFLPGIFDYLTPILEKEDCLLLGGGYKNSDWTKRDAFYFMNCDKPEYHNTIQLEAGVQVWKNTERSINILKEHLEYCKDYRILTDSPNECGLPNFEGFIDHRHDQSIMTNLFIKHKLPVDSTRHQTPYNQMRNYVVCNVM